MGTLIRCAWVGKFDALAKSEHSLDLAQLASRVASAMHTETSDGDDPSAKVKGFRKSLAETKGRDVYIREYLYVNVVLSCITMELTASAPSAMKIMVVAPPDLITLTVGALVMRECCFC